MHQQSTMTLSRVSSFLTENCQHNVEFTDVEARHLGGWAER